MAGEEGGRPPGAGEVGAAHHVAAEEATIRRESMPCEVGGVLKLL